MTEILLSATLGALGGAGASFALYRTTAAIVDRRLRGLERQGVAILQLLVSVATRGDGNVRIEEIRELVGALAAGSVGGTPSE